jgi:hypothetical protein
MRNEICICPKQTYAQERERSEKEKTRWSEDDRMYVCTYLLIMRKIHFSSLILHHFVPNMFGVPALQSKSDPRVKVKHLQNSLLLTSYMKPYYANYRLTWARPNTVILLNIKWFTFHISNQQKLFKNYKLIFSCLELKVHWEGWGELNFISCIDIDIPSRFNS